MRIVHIVVGKVNPDSLNGVSKVVHWMATSQQRQGHNVEVWGLTRSTTPSTRRREYPLKLFQMTSLRVTLSKDLRQAVNDLETGTWVHFHSVFVAEFPTIARLLTKRGFAYGITPHGGYMAGDLKKNGAGKRIYLAVREAGYIRSAKWIQAIGASEVADIRNLAPQVRVTLIPNAQELLARRNMTVPEGVRHPLIGYSGRLVKSQKGLDLLVEGFAAFKASGGAGELWLIGDGVDRAWLEKRVAESGAQPHVRFLGEKHGEEKLNLVASVDAFIHSSRWDVLPTACLEAAALGRPLVVSRETNLSDYVERWHAGLILDETSAAGVQRGFERVQTLFEADQLQRLGDGALAMIEGELQWEENAKRFVAAL
jgi:glycosyltransferase involved in cell wall biosynthesis